MRWKRVRNVRKDEERITYELLLESQIVLQ